MSDSIEPDVFLSVEPNVSTQSRGTLDEPIIDTFKRDLLEINSQLSKVIYPNFPLIGSSSINQEDVGTHTSGKTDLWAPLCFIILFSLFVSYNNLTFSGLFILCWILVLIMAFHLKLSESNQHVALISSISLSGYCIFPQLVHALLSFIIIPLIFKPIPILSLRIRLIIIFKLISLITCSLWSTSSIKFVTNFNNFVQIYPLSLCLFFLGWLCIIF